MVLEGWCLCGARVFGMLGVPGGVGSSALLWRCCYGLVSF